MYIYDVLCLFLVCLKCNLLVCLMCLFSEYLVCILQHVLWVVLEFVFCLVCWHVLCVVLEPRARFASPARFARSYLTKGRVRTPGDPGIVHVQWGVRSPPLNEGMIPQQHGSKQTTQVVIS